MIRARSKLAWLLAACALALFAATLVPSTRKTSSARPAPEPASPRAVEATPEARAVRTASTPSTLASSAKPDRHPHPITAEHRRLYREADLLDGAAALLRKSSIAEARALLAQHRAEYAPGQGSDNDGLALLADCLEHRDRASLDRARAFYDRYTHSMVRRQIRKQCLE
jgi:hypothetical protein